MNEEESTFQHARRKSSHFFDKSHKGGAEVSLNSLKQEREELDKEKKRIFELKNVVEAGREKLREEMESFESRKARENSDEVNSGSPIGNLPPDLQQERAKIEKEWKRIDVEERRLEVDRRKFDILFDEISSRKGVIDSEANETKEEKAKLKLKEEELNEREEILVSSKEEFQDEKARWEKTRAKQLDELRSLPDKKSELELERANLRLERMRFEEEKKPLDDERKYLEAKRKMMDQEREIIEQQKQIIEDQKKRLLESGTISIDAKYALETPIPKPREPLIPTSLQPDSSGSSVFTVDSGHLYQTQYGKKEAQLDRIRQERLKSLGTTKKPVLKAIRPGKSVGKAIRVGKLPAEKAAEKHPTMTCISCDTEIPIPPGSASVSCSKCGREYKIRSGSKLKATRAGKEQAKEKTFTQAPIITQPELKTDGISPGAPTFTEISDSSKEKAKLYEKQGHYFIHCLNPSCKAEIELSNPSKKRVHCPECGRRNKIASMEG